MREELKKDISSNLEASNVADAALYLPLIVPLMVVDYIEERLGYNVDIPVRVLDFLRYRCGLTTAKLLR